MARFGNTSGFFVSTSFVLALRALHVDLAAAPALTGTSPGKPRPASHRPRAAGHDGQVKPNLAKIPADGDAQAEAIVRRVHGAITQHLLDSLNERDGVALGRYGARQATIALRQRAGEGLSRSRPRPTDRAPVSVPGEVVPIGDRVPELGR
jgi:hypothetical protein